MTNRKSIVILFLLFSVFSSCSVPEKPSEQSPANLDTSTEKEKVKQTLVDMWDAIEKADMDRYASHIHPDFTSFGETAKKLRSGKEAEVKAIKEWVEEPTKVYTEMLEPEVTINGNVAWITYYWSDSGTSKGEKFATRGKSTRIFVNERGKWLCIHGHYTLLEDDEK
ncbi:MAG: nuclear transport factor 2 family protein [Pyrinomonadaceae bacterium]|nr:nuclear transport factor 2 family protein [Pyrinomonadaceae bacterium]